MSFLPPIAGAESPCKCCGFPAKLYGVVDFNKNCEQPRRWVLDLSGIPVYYHRCGVCGFLFTTAFDEWTPGQFMQYIYNEQYALVDPDYENVRPESNAATVAQLLAGQPSLRILDYGGGNGRLTTLLRQAGFNDAHCYDPFVPESSQRPEGLFDCIVSFEVFEHSPDPRHIIGDILSMLKAPGIVLFSTLIQPANIEQEGVNWWYVAPRNGHVSLHSQESMRRLGQALNFSFGSFNSSMHVLYRSVPPFASRWFGSK